MWWTPDGERILQGAEGRLFREALGMIVDMVRDDKRASGSSLPRPSTSSSPTRNWPSWPKSAPPCSAKDQPMPRLTAALEAAVGAVYEAVRLLVEMEIDQPARVA